MPNLPFDHSKKKEREKGEESKGREREKGQKKFLAWFCDSFWVVKLRKSSGEVEEKKYWRKVVDFGCLTEN